MALTTSDCAPADAFAAYLPDLESVRSGARSGGGRKWQTLASALHRETGAWMTIPTEGAGTSQHGLHSKKMAIITSDCVKNATPGIKWP